MKALIQRVTEASVTIDGKLYSSIKKGFLVFLGIDQSDDLNDGEWLCRKIGSLRIFSDENGLMNKSITDIDGELLLVSQFTLIASYKKGNRPSFINAAKPEQAIPLYNGFIDTMQALLNKKIATGVFGADMKVKLCNDGPVTIMMDTKIKD